ncbi:MAG: glutamate--tRNA ligase [Bacteroidetes bacterium]|nr:glutamate--tRNA ligase [Bacteroidota bacterium]
MSERKVRVRFAPSPTGPLHIGGVRTALYNYLFAKKNGGDFILRIEDTDQNRFVPGAEEYVIESIKWCGIEPNEGIGFGDGAFAPYRQSERKAMYRQYADQLVKEGHAYYAFDTSEELEEAVMKMKNAGETFSYNAITRQKMKNSLVLSEEEIKKKLEAGERYVIRIKIPENEEVRLHDIIRGWVVVQSSQMDDKVLFKSDGMPTYHLANVVDDYLMKISHVIRGEEWLPSAPLHVLLYEYLGWKEVMPEFAHLPLLLRPDGNGKLSKRDGDRLGFPVFPLSAEMPDAKTGKPEKISGYREAGYFPDAFINMLALLGWNPGTEQEIFTMNELVNAFSFEHIHKSGARFNPEKAKWFNQQYLHKKNAEELADIFTPILNEHLKSNSLKKKNRKFIETVCSLVKEKATFVSDFWNLSSYIFITPTEYDNEVIKKRWNDKSKVFFESLIENLKKISGLQTANIDQTIKQTCEQVGIKSGEVMQLTRVLISGKGSGVDLLGMMELLGRDEVCNRLAKGVTVISNSFSKINN